MSKELSPVSSALMDIVKKQVIKIIIQRVAFLKFPFFNPLLGMVVGKLLKIIFTETEFALYAIAIDKQAKQESENLSKAQDKLSQAKTEEEIKQAELEVINAARELIKFTK